MFRTKLDYFLKHNKLFLTVFTAVASFIIRFIGLFVSIDKNLVLFTSHSRGFSDSPRVLYERMKKDPYYSEFKLVWGLENPELDIYKDLNSVKSDTFKYFLTALSAKYWITSVNIERGLKFKKKETIFLNTWHGVAINEMGNAVQGRNDFDWSHTDYICYSAEYEREIYYRDFNARPESMIPTGLPRNDELYQRIHDRTYIASLKNRLGLPQDKKIILYAPTWRDSNDFGSNYLLTPPIDWHLWREQLAEDYVVLLRTHPYTTKLMGVDFNEFVLDMTTYPLINDLLLVSDILISDYSSIIFDYTVLERPILCFAYDYEAYTSKRGLYLDLKTEMPSGIILNQNDLLSHILEMDYELECAKTKELKNRRLTYGGNAAEACLKALFKTEGLTI